MIGGSEKVTLTMETLIGTSEEGSEELVSQELVSEEVSKAIELRRKEYEKGV